MVKNGGINKFFSICVTLYFSNLNSFRFNFLPNTKKSNNTICGNYSGPLALLSKHIQTTIKVNIPRSIPMSIFVSKRKGLYQKRKHTTLLQFLVLLKIFFINCSKPLIWDFSIKIFVSLLQSREFLCICRFIF